jgi:GT2 family glycosyltransferase/glycosyltransferase involved in cell wall biosynthesis
MGGEKDNASGRKAIIVTGMHRSGTSAVTRLLNLLGAALPGNLMPANHANETGYWESMDLYSIHEELFSRVGTSWDDVLSFPERWFASEEAQGFQQRILAVLRQEFGAARLFVIKDPRISRLVPLWLAVLRQFESEPRFVLTWRHPLEVAASLKTRDGIPRANSLLLWLRHRLEVEKATRGQRRSFVSYDALLLDWRAEIDRIGHELGIRWSGLSAKRYAEIDAFLSAHLRHHKYSERELDAYPEVGRWVKRIHRATMQAKRGSTLKLEREFDAVRRELENSDIAYGPIISSLRANAAKQTGKRDEQIARLTQTVAERDGQITERAREVQAQRDEVARLTGLMQQRDAQIANLQETVGERDEQIARLTQTVTERDGQIAEFAREAQAQRGEVVQLNGVVQQRDAQIANLQETVGERDEQITQLTQAVTERDKEIAALGQESQAEWDQVVQLKRIVQQREERLITLDGTLREREAEVNRLSETLADRTHALAEIKAALEAQQHVSSEREQRILELEEIAKEREGRIANLAHDRTERDSRIKTLNQAVAERDAQITAILQSNSWRVTWVFRAISALLRSSSRRLSRGLFLGARSLYRFLPIRNDRIRLAVRGYAFRRLGWLLRGGVVMSPKPVPSQLVPVTTAPRAASDPMAYLLSPADESLQDDRYPVTRLMAYLWRSRPDLQRSFDLYDPQSRLEFSKWFLTHAESEYCLPAEAYPDALLDTLIAQGGETAARARTVIAKKAAPESPAGTDLDSSNQVDTSGANVIGYARAEFGLGEHMRMVARAFASVRRPFTVIDYPEVGFHGLGDDGIVQWITERQLYGVNIFNITADIFPALYFKFGSSFFAGHYNIGYWAWELSKCPPEFDISLNMVDEVWAISEFVAESFRQRSPVPVVNMPLPITVPPLERAYTKRYFGLPENPFVFLFIFDAASYLDRKNPIATVRAFKMAFPRGDERVHLLLKTMNNDNSDPLWRTVMEEARFERRITIMTKRLSRDEVLGLYTVCDAFVSLHRGEGFGLCLAEAMLFGKPVVATNYSGTREFAREGTACLVDHTLVPVPEGSYPFCRDQVWAEPDLDCAAALMRRLMADDQYRDNIARAGQSYVRDNFNEETIGARYAERLDAIKTLKSGSLPSLDTKNVGAVPTCDELVGCIDLPSDTSEPTYGPHVRVAGWVVSRAGIESVDVYCDGMLMGRAHYGVLRPDIGQLYSHMPSAGRSGFFWLLDTTNVSPGSHTVRVVARSGSGQVGEWVRVFSLGDANKLYEEWISNNVLDLADQVKTSTQTNTFDETPLLSIIVRVTSSFDHEAALRTFASLAEQNYRAFELVVAAGVPDGQELEDIARRTNLFDKLRLLPVGTYGWTHVIDACRGEFVSFLDIGDVLDPRALYAAAQNIIADAEVDFLYADEDRLVNGQRRDPVFKPAWSPIYLEGHNYVGRPWFAQKALAVVAVTNIPRTDDEHTLLKLIGRSARAVCHVPMVLVSRAIKDRGVGLISSARIPVAKQRKHMRSSWPRVSVIIPTRLADLTVVDRCFMGLLKETDYPDLEVIIIVNNLDNPSAGETYLKGWPFKFLSWDGPFNWSRINNFAARQATGDYLLFMNDDVEPLGRGWLKAMVDLGRIESVGAVGAVLRYPNGTIQHAGITLFGHGGGSDHTFRHCSGKESHIASLIAHNREQSGVTGACLLSRRDCFNAVGGFDEEFSLVCNDTDYCLRLWENGFSCVVAAGSELTHHEGVSRIDMPETDDMKRFWARWKSHIEAGDPFSNPNLNVTRMDWSIGPKAKGTLTGRVRRSTHASAKTERGLESGGYISVEYGTNTTASSPDTQDQRAIRRGEIFR